MDVGILLFFTLSVMRYLKPFGFYPISLAIFVPMLCGNGNLLAVITCGIKDWPLENTRQVAKQRINFVALSCSGLQLITGVLCFFQ